MRVADRDPAHEAMVALETPLKKKTISGGRGVFPPRRASLVSSLVAGPHGAIGVDSPEIADGPRVAMHYRARTYFPEIARFAQVDPLIAERMPSQYLYVLNNPTSLGDPSGHQPGGDPFEIEDPVTGRILAEGASHADVIILQRQMTSRPREYWVVQEELKKSKADWPFSVLVSVLAGTGLASEVSLTIIHEGERFVVSYKPPPTWHGESTSVFFIYKAGNTTKQIRLDYGPNVRTGGSTNWHWNQRGVHDIFNIEDHTVIKAPALRGTGWAFKGLKVAGRFLLVAGVVIDGVEIATAEDKVKVAFQKVGAWAAAAGGAAGGARGGAYVGRFFGPWGIAIGTTIGGIGGGTVGYLGAEYVVGEAYDLFRGDAGQ